MLSVVNTEAPKQEQYGFEDFWSLYYRREAKKDALKAWSQVVRPEMVHDVLVAAFNWRRVWQAREDIRYVPLAASWLRGERFYDELPAEYAQRAASHTPFPAKPNEPHVRTELPDHVKAAIAKVRKS